MFYSLEAMAIVAVLQKNPVLVSMFEVNATSKELDDLLWIQVFVATRRHEKSVCEWSLW